MTNGNHHWITLHRVRFPDRVSAHDQTFEAPALPECWRFCPGQDLGDNGLPTWTSDVWGGLGIHETRANAEAMIVNPAAHLPWLSEAVEDWHGLAIPVAHHGAVKWRAGVEEDSALRTASGPQPGQMIVVTTAGFNSRDPGQIPRITRFAKGVQEVIDYYGTREGNIRLDVFNGGFDGRDGFTLTIWNDDKAMIAAAYKPGVHKAWMDQSKDGSLFDRSSFTRARLVSSYGTWDGSPVVGIS
jgi:hypothetical protein